jgi:hypothetical protein
MSEHINNQDLLGSGGHTWVWEGPAVNRKTITSPGTRGGAGMVINVEPRPGRVQGADGRPAFLLGAPESALRASETAIETLYASGAAVAWEDDNGRSGSSLILTGYRPVGERITALGGGEVWQMYYLDVLEMDG